jgi:inosose dehydratase
MGLQSYTLRSMSLEKCLEAMANTLKIYQVELFSGHHAGMSLKQVQDLLAKYNVKCVAYGVVPLKKDPKANRQSFETGKALGIKSLSADPDPDAFDTLDKQVEEFGIPVAIHPHGPGHRWAKVQTIWDAVKGHHKMIGLCADTGHLIRAGEDPVAACRTFKDRLYGLHLKDFKKLGDNKWEDVPASDGSLDTDALVKLLLDQHFQGALSIEYEGGQPVEATQKTLERVRQAVRKAKGAA